MGVRLESQDNEAEIMRRMLRRIRVLEDTVKRRALPPGYEWSFDNNGSLIVTRTSDGATQVVAF